MHRKAEKLMRLANEAEAMAKELVSNRPIRFRKGFGVLLHLLARCGHYDAGLERDTHGEELPQSLRTAIQSLIHANGYDESERRMVVMTALFGLSRIIHTSLAYASGMADASLNSHPLITQ